MSTVAAAGERRRIDHVVMPVPSLEASRTFFESLGFLVAGEALHPFGTKNACVFLADGAYLEPLAVAYRETCEAEAKRGNAFVARDQAHRFRVGEPSFSGVALSSHDAYGDRDALQGEGFGLGELLEFSRRFTTADGTETELGFRLAFALDRRSPDVSLFTCQPTHAQAPDRSSLTGHPNAVVGLSRVVFAEPNPTDFQYLLQHLTGDREMVADSFAMTLRAGEAAIEVATPASLWVRYGGRRDERRGLSFEGVVLRTRDIGATRAFVEASGQPFEIHRDRLVVRLAPTASSFIAFEESRA